MDRTVDVVRLAGHRISAAGKSMTELVIEMASIVSEFGGEIDAFYFPHLNIRQLLYELGNKKTYREETIAGVSFRGVEVETDDGPVVCYSDRNTPAGYGFGVETASWEFCSVGDFPAILDLDNVGTFLREAASDGYEMRVGGYPQVVCHRPWCNIIATNLPTAYS